MITALTLIIGCSYPVTKNIERFETHNSITTEYKIQSGDQLDVKFFYNPELNEQLTVRSDGKISLQLVNEVIAAGLTPSKLTAVLTKAYSAELSNPRITVIVKTSIADRIFVDGEVNRAGLFTLIGPTTVSQAIIQAGGLKNSAKNKKIIIIRRENGGQPTYMTVNYKKIIDGQGTIDDIYLKPNDIVFVPKSVISNVNAWIDLYLRQNVPLPIGIGYNF